MSSGRADDMVERTVKSTASLALGAALGYVTLMILTRWVGLRSRDHLGAERNGFHPELFV
jgi:hypothetical protein